MLRTLSLLVLIPILASCVLLVDDDPRRPQGTIQPSNTAPAAVAPTSGSFTYVCRGGRLAVTYTANAVTVFYDGANRNLTQTRSNPTSIYTDGTYTWEAEGRAGRLSVRGVLADTCNY
ncbi:MAG: hypothetical protein SFU83_07245 [Meiothermus sp.]|nr:hypothetical protein [Meiothermus sp.]